MMPSAGETEDDGRVRGVHAQGVPAAFRRGGRRAAGVVGVGDGGWRGAPAAGAALRGGSVWGPAAVAARARRADPAIRNLVICCQENRSFDHYFGFAPEVQAKGFGPPAGYSQPDEN